MQNFLRSQIFATSIVRGDNIGDIMHTYYEIAVIEIIQRPSSHCVGQKVGLRK